MIFWAKDDQIYREHVFAAYEAWKETIKAKEFLIKRLASEFDFPIERFLQGSLLTVTFHDVGKMTDVFQKMIIAKREGKPWDVSQGYRHELVSFIYTEKYRRSLNKRQLLSSIPLESIAVAGHHRPLNSDLTFFERECLAAQPNILSEGVTEAINIAEEIFKLEGFSLQKLDESSVMSLENPYKSLAGLFFSGMLSKGIQKDGEEKCRTLYFLLKGILHYADWYGSGKMEVNYGLTYNASVVVQELSSRCREKEIDYQGLRPFQKACRDHSGDLIAIAPTGSGKTEASLLWALNNIREKGEAKIIYLLPTMVTANAIWARLVDFFGNENVGLAHSTARLFFKDVNDEESEEDRWENRRDILLSRTFMKPVTVATIDQLLTMGFNAGRWTLKEANAANAVIIIDEIHAYEEWTLGLVTSTIRHLSGLGARFMIMSATLPKKILELLEKTLENALVVKENKLLNAARSRYFLVDNFIDSAYDRIAEAVQAGKRVLVIVNTVGLCQEMSFKLSHLDPICYHSQFVLKDRKTIEKKVEEGRLVIATQVVEVSLDIDYDWLFTECAPPDAIAQRAGRVNRYRDDKRDSRVYIFRPSEKGEKVYNQVNDPDLLERSFQAFRNAPERLTESGLTSLVEEVYAQNRLEESEIFKDALGQYRLSQKGRNMIFDSRRKEDSQEVTRQVKYETVSVIPKCFMEEVLSANPTDRQWYEVKLPLWYVMKNREDVKGITFCDIDYSAEIGATYKKDEIIPSMIT